MSTYLKFQETAYGREAHKLVIARTNKYGGKVVFCEKHRMDVMPNITGSPFTEEFTDKPCHLCVQEKAHAEAPAKMREALLDSRCVRTRFRGFGNSGYITAYFRDATSPSGVRSAATLGLERFEILEKEMMVAGEFNSCLSPLSPTEGLRL